MHTGRLCASSHIRSLRSVMRLRRALPPQSRGNQRHCWAEPENRRNANSSKISRFRLPGWRIILGRGSSPRSRASFLPKHVLMTVLVEKIPCGHPLRFLELGKRSADRVKGNPIRWFPYQNRHQNVFSPMGRVGVRERPPPSASGTRRRGSFQPMPSPEARS